MCLPFCHKWKTKTVYKYRDISFGEPGTMHTEVLYTCRVCGKARVKCYSGLFNLPDFQEEKDVRNN